nr:hypothetical protein [uncultured Oscillibacter sp.]
MFIASKNHILIPGADGREAVRIPRGFVGSIPDWVGGTAYFKALVQCGKITLPEDGGKAPLVPVPKPSKEKRGASQKGKKKDSPAPAPGREEAPPKDSAGEEAPPKAPAGEPGESGVETGGGI